MNISISPQFTEEDIHNVRIQMAEAYRKMSPEEAERDFQQRVSRGNRRIEELRKQKAMRAGIL
jgi:hypothetical protein